MPLQFSHYSSSGTFILLPVLQFYSPTYFTYSPPYFLLPPATYPLQQLLVPVHRPYSFTLPPTPSSWLLQLPSSFYQFSFFDNYQLQYQWLQLLSVLLPLPAPAQTFEKYSTSTYFTCSLPYPLDFYILHFYVQYLYIPHTSPAVLLRLLGLPPATSSMSNLKTIQWLWLNFNDP